MKGYSSRAWADYGGMLNAMLCLLHCAAGPLLLAWWSGQKQEPDPLWDLLFLLVSGVLVVGATWRLTAWRLKAALWAFFTLFAVTILLADAYPWMELAQYGTSVGLLGTHLLNLRHCRRAAPVA
ncbi:MerC domain-containing protein [Hymenobacter sediminis]|uniref:MerC domain-containing protein n=1 Tax=Hymenobacter sediminis TaxID=2218621 RepID=UPI00138FE85D|nr:MerC domain-containing protein [Hymenobacter sediminis]